MPSLFGRYEAAALLGVERANGGEFAPLEQVIAAFEQLFGMSVAAETFAESIWLLIDARLVDWRDGGLELTYEGRKAIRKSGAHWAEDFPDRVASTLSAIDEGDLAPEGELPAPTDEEVAAAMKAVRSGGLSGEIGPPAMDIPPSRMAGVMSLGARMLSGLPGGVVLNLPGTSAAPLVAPLGSETDEDGGESAHSEPPMVSPSASDSGDGEADAHAHPQADDDRSS